MSAMAMAELFRLEIQTATIRRDTLRIGDGNNTKQLILGQAGLTALLLTNLQKFFRYLRNTTQNRQSNEAGHQFGWSVSDFRKDYTMCKDHYIKHRTPNDICCLLPGELGFESLEVARKYSAVSEVGYALNTYFAFI